MNFKRPSSILVKGQVCESNVGSVRRPILLWSQLSLMQQWVCWARNWALWARVASLVCLGASQSWESYETRADEWPVLCRWCFSKTGGGGGAGWLFLKPPRGCHHGFHFLGGFESVEGGRNSGLCLNIFAFVLVGKINLGVVSLHRNDLFLHSLTHFLCQACCWLSSGTNPACWWAVSLSVYRKS